MSEGSDDDKQHEPSQRRLDEARKRGQVPRSQDITGAAVYGALLATLMAGGGWLLSSLAGPGAYLLGNAGNLTDGSARRLQAVISPVFHQTCLALAVLLVPMSLAALASVLGQRGLVFAPEKLHPKLSRISPLANAAQKFGLDGLMEFAKSIIKLAAISGLLVWQITRHMDQLAQMSQSAPRQSLMATLSILADFLLSVTLFTAVVGLADLLWQRLRHIRRNRMSHQEAREEAKDSDGDPHLKSHRRRRAQELALSSMLVDVAKADVVIVNPTHYAVALRWKRTDLHAPICLAKGVDEVAARIRERAGLAGVPLHRDPPTARALHATVEVGQPIRPDQYRAVAAAIRFAVKMRQKQRQGPR